jgi:hypothetical protein
MRRTDVVLYLDAKREDPLRRLLRRRSGAAGAVPRLECFAEVSVELSGHVARQPTHSHNDLVRPRLDTHKHQLNAAPFSERSERTDHLWERRHRA